MDSKLQEIYEEFRCELGIHEKDIINAQNLHKDLRKRNPFRYESPFLISAVCVYAILDVIPQKITLEEIEKISHIKKEDILKCYKMILDTDFGSFLPQKDDRLSP